MDGSNIKVGVIILGDHVQGLGIIRCFGKKKIPVYLVNDKKVCIGRFSRFLAGFFESPNFNAEHELISFLMSIGKSNNFSNYLLMPTNDLAVSVLSKHKDRLSDMYQVVTPDAHVTDLVYNKRLTFELAKSHNVPIPNTVFPEDINELDAILCDIEYPVLIKGAIGHIFYKITGTKAYVANCKEDIFDFYYRFNESITPSDTLIQELIDGPTENVYSFCSFFKDGSVVAWWSGKKVRAHPMLYGTATLAESVREQNLLNYGSNLLKAMSYYGISEIEFKLDPKDGTFKLLEMNARTWLWISLAIKCGVNLPYIMYSDIVNNETIITDNFKEHIKWLHIYTDCATVIGELIHGRMSIGEYLSSIKGEKEFAVLSLDDPLPFVAETLILPYLWFTR